MFASCGVWNLFILLRRIILKCDKCVGFKIGTADVLPSANDTSAVNGRKFGTVLAFR